PNLGRQRPTKRHTIRVTQRQQRRLHFIVKRNHIDENRIAIIGGCPDLAGHKPLAVLPRANLRLTVQAPAHQPIDHRPAPLFPYRATSNPAQHGPTIDHTPMPTHALAANPLQQPQKYPATTAQKPAPATTTGDCADTAPKPASAAAESPQE
ncbi:hypothetical protein KCU90_g10387, partial [Aureobasidium melanogenum]